MNDTTLNYPYRARVYYEDTDAAGVVYHANYLKWMERARTEWLRSMDVGLSEILNAGCALVAHHIDMTYHSPARLEDEIVVRCSLVELGFVRLSLYQSIELDGSILAEGTITLAVVDPESFKPKRMPVALKERLLDACA